MSEFQYVGFCAIDRPVEGENLEYMQRQSSRAEITPWSFENEYYFGDFRGDPMEMLRRGYDIHLHYANFGIRKLAIRFPLGISDRTLQPYAVRNNLRLLKDKQGPGGNLIIAPFQEPGDWEELFEVDSFLDRLAPLRAEIMDGDLRPLYLGHLAVACDGEHDPDKTTEAPVPAGLAELSDAQQALVEFYGLDREFIQAAAEASLPSPARDNPADHYPQWIRDQPEKAKNAWLTSLMVDSATTVRAEMLAKYRSEKATASWPTSNPGRTIAELRTEAADIAEKRMQRVKETAARERAERLAGMSKDPKATLRETERLVKERSTNAYRKIGELLSELREALLASKQSGLAEKQAAKLKAANPTLRSLVSELRRHNLLPK